ncbi:MAG: hypothetical protein QXQ79_00245 [Candidatus Nanoarchaeia archaeon]
MVTKLEFVALDNLLKDKSTLTNSSFIDSFVNDVKTGAKVLGNYLLNLISPKINTEQIIKFSNLKEFVSNFPNYTLPEDYFAWLENDWIKELSDELHFLVLNREYIDIDVCGLKEEEIKNIVHEIKTETEYGCLYDAENGVIYVYNEKSPIILELIQNFENVEKYSKEEILNEISSSNVREKLSNLINIYYTFKNCKNHILPKIKEACTNLYSKHNTAPDLLAMNNGDLLLCFPKDNKSLEYCLFADLFKNTKNNSENNAEHLIKLFLQSYWTPVDEWISKDLKNYHS